MAEFIDITDTETMLRKQGCRDYQTVAKIVDEWLSKRLKFGLLVGFLVGWLGNMLLQAILIKASTI